MHANARTSAPTSQASGEGAETGRLGTATSAPAPCPTAKSLEDIYYPTWNRLDGLLVGVALAVWVLATPGVPAQPQPFTELFGDFEQAHHLPRARRAFDLETLAVVGVEPQQRGV